MKYIFTFLLGISYFFSLGQPFSPCFSPGTAASCTCETASVICDVNELDGYNFNMTSFQHPADGPQPMCAGQTNTVSNNPTWVAFLAWCSSFDIELSFNSCTFRGGTRGLQAAIYSSCQNAGGTNVVDGGCATAINQGCNVAAGIRVMNITGLVVGRVYYLLVDGCGGSACDVTINVLNSDGCTPTIPAFTGEIEGPDIVCLNDVATYTAESPTGSTRHDWSISPATPVLIEGSEPDGTGFTSTTITWSATGNYTICVDASNSCVPTVGLPLALCKPIKVRDAEAGNITVTPQPICPNGTVTITATGFSTNPDISQYIFVADASGNIVAVWPGGGPQTFTWDDCADFTAYSYNYITALGSEPMVGDNVTLFGGCTSTSTCCELVSAPFSFSDTAPPVLAAAPPNITVSCFLDIPTMPMLSYTDNCIPSGSVDGVQDDNYTECDGGTITRTWTVTDICDNSAERIQTITLLPVPVATFTPFADVTVSCNNFPPASFLPTLAYTNGQTGSCAITGTIIPTRAVDTINCEGTVTYTWSFTDLCGREIFDDQVYTVEPPAEIAWVNPPVDTITITCSQIPGAGVLPPLQYDNGGTGNCRIFGTVIPTRMDNYTLCGGELIFDWNKTDSCGRSISYQQIRFVEPAPVAEYVNPPADITVSCIQKPLPSSAPNLSYTNALNGFCSIAGSVVPIWEEEENPDCSVTITVTWDTEDECFRQILHTQTITVNPPPQASFINPPANISVNCPTAIPVGFPPLTYNNNVAGACNITGQVIPTRVDNLTGCIGTVTFTWDTIDRCGRAFEHIQTIVVDAPIAATFINPPADQTVLCINRPADNFFPTLQYSNGVSGVCGIAGTVVPTREINITDCVGTITFTWDTIDYCDRPIIHIQIYTIQPPLIANYVNPPASFSVNCPSEVADDYLPDLNYTNGSSGACLISGMVTPVRVNNITDCTGTITLTWSTTDFCNRVIEYVQTITVNPPTIPAFVNPPASISVNCPNIPADDFYPPLNYTNGVSGTCAITGTVIPTKTVDITDCVGTITLTWDTIDYCNRAISYTQTLTILPPPVGVINNPPADQTVNCPSDIADDYAPVLTYTNGSTGSCLIAGNITPTRVDNLVDCAGTIILTWDTLDYCNRLIQHIQTITINPPAAAQFVNPPASATVPCTAVPADGELPPLMYTNNVSGACEIMGEVIPTRTDNIVDCAGTITLVWETIDFCNRPLSYTQILTVLPPVIATYTNPPANRVVQCDAIPADDDLPPLNYTNNSSGDCLIEGITIPARVDAIVNCAGTIIYTWQETDFCNRPITHTQVITVVAPPAPAWINPPPSGNVTCANVPPDGELPLLGYTNGSATCEIAGQVEATRLDNIVNCAGTITLNWEFTDECNRRIAHQRIVTVLPPDQPNFVSPPPPVISVPCDQEPDPSALPELLYTNNGIGACLIEGSITPRRTEVNTNCGKVITYNWDDTDRCGRTLTYTQVVTVLPPPVPTLVNPPVYNTPLSCADAELFNAPDLDYSNNSPCAIVGTIRPVVNKNFTACGGNIQITWNESDRCGNIINYTQVIVVQRSAEPVLTTPVPEDITVACQDISAYAIPLEFTNGETRPCERGGIIPPVLSSSYTLCGGTASIRWEARDDCGFTVSEVQNITILPAPPAEFIDLPDPRITVSCTEIPAVPPALNYSNGEIGFCAISGAVSPLQTGSYNACGGIIRYTWQFTDPCGRSISYIQDVTVLPADEPAFIDPPLDQSLPCGENFTPPVVLQYSNGLTGSCRISGSVNATTENQGDTRIYTWTYRNTCTGNEITARQEVYKVPVPDIVIDPANIDICTGGFYDLNTIAVTDLNNTNITITYHTGTPANASNEVPGGLVLPDNQPNFYILATNEFGCTDEARVTFRLVFPPQAGFGQNIEICNDNRTVNLWDYLDPPFDTNGTWTDTYGTGLDISNPMMVSLANQPAGNYPFDYIVTSTNLCPDAVAIINIELIDAGFYEILEVACSNDFSTYSVRLSIFGYTITTNRGTVTGSGNNRVITNIPIAETVEIILTSLQGDCAPQSFTVSPPNCSCPTIAPPISGGNITACQNDTGKTLTVTVGTGLTANWFTTQSGQTPIRTKSLNFLPNTSAVGIFTFYVEAIDTLNNCFSTRIPVSIEVFNLPATRNVVLEVCDTNNDGLAQFDLSTSRARINPNSTLIFTFHLTRADAVAGTNPLPNFYTNTSNGQVVFAKLTNANNCSSVAEVTLNVLAQPMVTFIANSETCANTRDGRIEINAPFTGLEFRINALPWTSNNVITGLSPNTYNLQVRNSTGCISTYSVVIGVGQVLNFDQFNLVCDNKGTKSIETDDVYNLTLRITNTTAANNPIVVRYGTTNLGTFTYNTVINLTLPSDGTSGVLEIEDTVTGCKTTRPIGPLTPCSTECEIIPSGVSFVCNNNNTDSDSSDDKYVISFNTSSLNSGATGKFTLLVNGIIIGTYDYGQFVTFELPANGNTPLIVLRDVDNVQCVVNVPSSPLIPCSSACSIAATLVRKTCDNNGTINDPSDDRFTVEVRVNGFNTSTGWRLGASPTVYAYNTNVVLPSYLISGGNVTLQIVDNADATCSTMLLVTPTAPCSTPCVLEVFNLVVGVCNNNGTNNIAADDKFNISFQVNAISGSTSFYNITLGAQTYGPFLYGQPEIILGLPANGQTLTLTILDSSNPGCTATITARVDPCSVCTQTVSAGADITLTCVQNTASLAATTTSTGAVFVWSGPNGFNRTGASVQTSNVGTYTVTATFPDGCVVTDMVVVAKDANLPTSNAGNDLEFNCNIMTGTLTGSSNLTSDVRYEWTNAAGTVIGTTLTITVTQLGSYFFEAINSSNNCASGKDEVVVFDRLQRLVVTSLIPECNNNGTTSDGTDDKYRITFRLTNTTNATNTFEVRYLGTLIGTYTYGANHVITDIPADNSSRVYEFIDLVTGCKTTATAGPLEPCSTNCLISYDGLTVACDNKGSETDETDDVYTISFTASVLNGGAANRFVVLINGIIFNTYDYGRLVTFTLPANKNTPFIQLRDANNNQCILTIPVGTLNPCSSSCLIFSTVSNILCNDNGTINNPSDDVYSFDIIVDGTNTSTNWKVNGTSVNRNYRDIITLGPFAISAGEFVLKIEDSVSPACTFDILIKPPSVCSEPCVLAAVEIVTSACNNNNTGNITTDDKFNVTFRVNRISGSAVNYRVSDGTRNYGPFRYNETLTINDLPANGNNIVLIVTDPSNSGCVAQFIVTKPPCSSCSQIVEAGADQVITCAINNLTLSAIANPTTGAMYAWIGPNNFRRAGASFTTSAVGKYVVTVLYPDGCIAKDSLFITRDASVPEAGASVSGILNCEVDKVTLRGEARLSANLRVEWTNAANQVLGTTLNIDVTTAGSYFFEVIDIVNNCSSGKVEVVVEEDKVIPAAVIFADPNNAIDCIIGEVRLFTNPQNNILYSWQVGENTFNNVISILVREAGTSVLTAVDTINGCINTSRLEIIDLQDYPILVTTPALPITCLNNSTVISARNSPKGLNLVYQWINPNNQVIANQTADSLRVNAPGRYIVILTDTLNGCSNADTILVDRIGDFPVVSVTPRTQTLYCGDNTTTFTAAVGNPTGTFDIVWSSANGQIVGSTTTERVNVSGSGDYDVEVRYIESGCITTESVRLVIDSDFPTGIIAATTDETCKDDRNGTLVIDQVVGGRPPYTYNLNNRPVTDFDNLSSGNYALRITDANGCSTETVFVIEAGNAFDLSSITPIEVIYNTEKTLELLTNLRPDEIASIKWTPSKYLSCDDCLVATILGDENVTYTVVVIDIYGCSQSISIRVQVRDNTIITVPNIINPSGSGNKFFTVYGNEGVKNIIKLSVFDRWGNLIFIKENFAPNNPQEGWDGTFSGRDVVPGVYVYAIEYETRGGIKVLAGDVTVIR